MTLRNDRSNMIGLTKKEFSYPVLSNARCAAREPIRFASVE
jgi:hypothetical protein